MSLQHCQFRPRSYHGGNPQDPRHAAHHLQRFHCLPLHTLTASRLPQASETLATCLLTFIDRLIASSTTQWRDSSSELSHSQSGSDPFDSYESSPVAGPSNPPSPPAPVQSLPNPTPATPSQWFWVGPQTSSQAIAEKTCEMVCYLWFSNTLGAHKSSPHHVRPGRRTRTSHSPSDPPSGLSDASTAALQFAPSTQFVNFMQKLLQTTQVSQSVIVLSLRYVYRLKEENHFTNGQPGSEFRVAVVALMMANKFVDE